MDHGDEELTLSSTTLEALSGFYQEKDERQKRYLDLKAQAETHSDHQKLSMDSFSEDWNASQFWYSDNTATTLAKQLLKNSDSRSSIAVISAPSVFVQLKNELADVEKDRRPMLRLLEYDQRFAVFDEFVQYDYTQPLKLPGDMKGRFDRIICDPPFLSADCQTKAALTTRWLLRVIAREEHGTAVQAPEVRLIVCTGERMSSLILRLHRPSGVHNTDMKIVHAKGLSNEFRCYANFECGDWIFQKES